MSKFDLEDFVIKTLRSKLKRTPQYTRARQRAYVERGRYRCHLCNKILHYKKFQMDHINPIVTLDGKNNGLVAKIKRIFCDENGLQYICIIDHKIKTNLENKIRAQNRKNPRPNRKVESGT